MGSTQTKEEFVLAQNAVGSNQASIEEVKQHAYLTNILLAIVLAVIITGSIIFGYQLYKKCHVQLIRGELARRSLARIYQERASNHQSV